MTQLERLRASGIERLGRPGRFRYRRAGGGRVAAADRARIEALRIPPAWTGTVISASATAAVQAMGCDRAGRWQYLYHPRHVARRERDKATRLVHFIQALPRMRAAVSRDMRRAGLPREKVLASILRILSTCFLRPGSAEYADEHRTYGIATLRRTHVAVRGDVVEFDFRGKSGRRQVRELRDRQVARIVRALLRVPNRNAEVFKFLSADGGVVDVSRAHINAYIKEVMGERFSAKDFRTWAGTLVCASALARAGAERGAAPTAVKRTIAAAVRETADVLGNTPAVCRASYIDDGVLDAYVRGQVIARRFESVDELIAHRAHGLHPAEKALLGLLRGRAA